MGIRGRPTTEYQLHNHQSEISLHAGDDMTDLLYNNVSRELSVDYEQQHRSQTSEDAATDAGETLGRRKNNRPWLLSPKGKHFNIYVDRESLNQYISNL
jgi:hypothetical protein